MALTLPNGPDFVLLLLAVTALGAAAAPLNPAYTQAEFAFFLDDIAPRLLLLPASRPADAAAAAKAAGTPVLGVEAAADGPPDLLAGQDGAAGPAAATAGPAAATAGPAAATAGPAAATAGPAAATGGPAAATGGPAAATGGRPAAAGQATAGRQAAPQRSFEPAGPDDMALLLHTSGTTSRPKQVPLRHRNLMASARTIAALYELGADDVSFCVMPLFHVHGLVASTFAALAAGGAVIVAARGSLPRRFWRQAREHGATWLSAGPTLHPMSSTAADQGGPPQHAALRPLVQLGAVAGAAGAVRGRGYRVPMLEAYGMTEASHQMTSNPLPPARAGARLGRRRRLAPRSPCSTTAATCRRQLGEVVIRGPGVMSGYARQPEANAEAFIDGWFRTGDRGVLDGGYLTLRAGSRR